MENITLTPDQEAAKNRIAEWFFNTNDQVFILSGYAGTGKTFLIDYVVREVLHLKAGKEAVFVSPTVKAAANLVKNGTVAGTVHSLIYMRDGDEFDVDENGEIIETRALSFIKREKIDEHIRLIIIDEASMVNETVLNDLLSFGIKCLFAGDIAQLPPVNGVCPLMQNPHFIMKEIVRQAADNPIIQVETMARKGEVIPYGNYGDKVCVIRKNALSKSERICCVGLKTRYSAFAFSIACAWLILPLSGKISYRLKLRKALTLEANSSIVKVFSRSIKPSI